MNTLYTYEQHIYTKACGWNVYPSTDLAFKFWCSCLAYQKLKQTHYLPHLHTRRGYAEVLLLCFQFSHLHTLLLINTPVPPGKHLPWSSPHQKMKKTPKRTVSPRQCIGTAHSLPSLQEFHDCLPSREWSSTNISGQHEHFGLGKLTSVHRHCQKERGM